ncbi:MAG: sensor domain-containing protein [Microbacterium sp.]|uniref:sensor histidine kinase n=1 Tax=Microbacterium sp. TaxID=51671 RepID=UPI00198E2D61|nr:histidine kinase [Microbacterium sp.]MBD3757051.1 sensor domain-containing protein [Microbacterium sp.]
MTIATSATGSPSVAAPPSVARATRPHLASHLGAIAQLAAAGLVGSLLFGALATLLSLGVSLLLVLGIGILFLLAFLYLLWATSWLEHERVEGLYGFGVPTLRARRSGVPGFGGWMRTLWQQFIDGQMWRGVASAAIATVLGLVVLPTVAGLVASVGLAFAPLGAADTARVPGTGFQIEDGWAVGLGVLGVVISLAVLLGVALLHAVLTRAILVPSQEAQFAAQAQVAGAQRAGAVRASEVERTRIERDLHDGVQPRLVSVAMTLGLAQQKIDDDPAAAKALVDEAHTSTKAAITELRQLARGIHASVLDDRGLDAALSALAARSPIPVQLDVRVEGRCSAQAEAAVYFAIAESLTNAAKHSRGSEARVVVRRRDDGTLWARVEDNGIGGARVLPGGGLDGITNRILAAGGTARLDSPAGGPTALEVSVPCAS